MERWPSCRRKQPLCARFFISGAAFSGKNSLPLPDDPDRLFMVSRERYPRRCLGLEKKHAGRRDNMKKFIKYGVIVILAVVLLLAAFYFLFPKTAFELAIDAQRRSADLARKEVQVDDHRVVYLEGGTGETIVLLHGFGGFKD